MTYTLICLPPTPAGTKNIKIPCFDSKNLFISRTCPAAPNVSTEEPVQLQWVEGPDPDDLKKCAMYLRTIPSKNLNTTIIRTIGLAGYVVSLTSLIIASVILLCLR
ncbi:hypothetical protein Ciccas_005325 [Cichlidogyrus casuarinus]|uniref:Uncharacterized protein n=1 Tax=Cichlidogyrus casuarinus TaxID=1844966 RepID=A0ABD2Q975_9PLAT